jgi:hypothetical protein
VQVFTTSQPYTQPTGYDHVYVEVWGGGGGGASAVTGAAGGGGGYSAKVVALAAGTVVPVTVAAAVAAAANGQSSSFGSFCSASGGLGAGAGGTGAGGDVNLPGYAGSAGITSASIGAGGAAPLMGAQTGQAGSGVQSGGIGQGGGSGGGTGGPGLVRIQAFTPAAQGPTGPQGPQGTPGPTTPADAFVATLSADQAGVAVNTPVKVNFNTAGYNQNGKFSTSTSRWTPAAGPVQIEAQINFGTSAIGQYIIIYKNGVQFKYLGSSNANVFGAAISVVDTANGTDYYECWAQSSVANTILSNPVVTFFQAFAVAPQGPVGPQGPQGTPGPTTPADAFVATLSADQTGVPANTYTKVNFNTASYNQNGKFNASNGRWTPSAGPVQIEAQLYPTGSVTSFGISIYKNGAQLKNAIVSAGVVAVVAVDTANGTDYYECWVYSNAAVGVSSNPTLTFFQGFAIAPQGPAGLQGQQGPAGLGANPADAFVATLSADQTGVAANTWTKVNFNTAAFNQNGKFFTSGANAGRWIPGAGPVQIEAQLYPTAGGVNPGVSIYKNGVLFKYSIVSATAPVAITVVDNANGTDYYECWVNLNVAGGVTSATTLTFFQGFAISPQGPAGQNGATGPVGPPSVSAPAKIQLFTTSGTYTPSANLVSAVVEVIGGGGAGGGNALSASQWMAGGGGGSGAYARRALTSAQIGASQSITIGAAGIAVAGAAGGSGTATSLGSLVIAVGGFGGAAGNSGFGAGGAGGTVSGSVGDVIFAGASGVQGFWNNTNAGLGTVGGAGGSSAFGGGAASNTVLGAGLAASNYGSGGSGGAFNAAGNIIGGNGSAGVVIVTEYIGIPQGSPGVLPKQLSGLTLANDATTPATVLDIDVGSACSDDNTTMMVLSAASFTKAFTASNAGWAPGSGAGGLDSAAAGAGSLAASTWYHVFLIFNPTTSTTDVLVSTSATAPTMPTSYTKKRRIGSINTNASSQIIAFSQLGDKFLWRTPVQNYSAITLPTAVTALVLSVPLGIQTEAQITAYLNAAAAVYLTIWPSDQTGAGVNIPPGNITIYGWSAGAILTQALSIRANTTQNVSIQASAAVGQFSLVTQGWVDNRGK